VLLPASAGSYENIYPAPSFYMLVALGMVLTFQVKVRIFSKYSA
jgi:hypothetical protein